MDEASTSNINNSIYFCNPFKHAGHHYHRKSLRNVNENILKRHEDIVKGDKICDGCRKSVLKLPELNLESQYNIVADDVEMEEKFEILTPEKTQAIETLNISLSLLDETSIKKKCLNEKKYPENKLKKVSEAFRTKILCLNPETTIQPNDESEIVNQLKERFNSTTNKSLKMQILTTLPKSWTLQQIENEFGVTNFMARKAKHLVKEKGIMSSPDPKPGKASSSETV